MIAINNNPHDAMKTERGVSILKRYFKMRKLKKKCRSFKRYYNYHRHIHRRNEVLNCIAQGLNNCIEQCWKKARKSIIVVWGLSQN